MRSIAAVLCRLLVSQEIWPHLRPSLHLTMKNRTKHTEIGSSLPGLSLGCQSWDGSEDPSRRASNYMLMPSHSMARQRPTNSTCEQPDSRQPGAWQRFVRQALRRRTKKSGLAA